jgi:hypothetical protein
VLAGFFDFGITSRTPGSRFEKKMSEQNNHQWLWVFDKEPVGSLKDLAKIWCFLTSSLKVFGEPWFWVKTSSFENHWLVRVLEYLNLSCWFFSWKRAKKLPPTLI